MPDFSHLGVHTDWKIAKSSNWSKFVDSSFIFSITHQFASQTNFFNQIIGNNIILFNNINQKAEIDTVWKVSIFRVIPVWMWDNADQDNSKYRHFLRSVIPKKDPSQKVGHKTMINLSNTWMEISLNIPVAYILNNKNTRCNSSVS